MTMDTTVLILAGGRAERLLVLTRLRAKCAIPFGGRFRVIDFVLSNCVHSGLFRIGILAQYNPVSLQHHIGSGRPWDLDRREGGVSILQPYAMKGGGVFYRGTADAIYQNLDFIGHERIKEVLVLSGDQVYKMDYRPFIEYHRSHKSPLTIAVTQVSEEDIKRFGLVNIDCNGRVVRFIEKPKEVWEGFASMGIYIFDANYLREVIEERCGCEERFDIVNDIVIPLIEERGVYAYVFGGYWEDIGKLSSYYEANMALLDEFPKLNLYDYSWRILTRENDMPALRIQTSANVSCSLICNGAVIKGTVMNSIISGGVVVDEGAYISNSIVFEDSYVARGAKIENAIVDKLVSVGRNASIGVGDRGPYNEDFPEDLNSGITLIGKGAVIPEGYRIGKNCAVDIFVKDYELPTEGIESGKSVLLPESEIRLRGEHDILEREVFWD